jgi:hypothetical protein
MVVAFTWSTEAGQIGGPRATVNSQPPGNRGEFFILDGQFLKAKPEFMGLA